MRFHSALTGDERLEILRFVRAETRALGSGTGTALEPMVRVFEELIFDILVDKVIVCLGYGQSEVV